MVGDEVAAAAVIDRLLHFSTTVNICGESYRLKSLSNRGPVNFSSPVERFESEEI